jgi:hypothetical protein
MATQAIDFRNEPPHSPSTQGEEAKRGSLNTWKVTDLHQRLNEINTHPDYTAYCDLQNIALPYGQQITPCQKGVALVVVALSIMGVAAYILLVSNHLTTFPQDLLNLFHTVNPLSFAIGGGITLLLVTGAAIVMHRARTGREKLLKTDLSQETPKRGAIRNMEKHLETGLIKCDAWKQQESNVCYIDLSTLDEQRKNGKAYLYGIKDCGNHYSVSTIVTFVGTPPYLIAVIAYYLIRAVIAPFYVLVQLLREKILKRDLFPEERPFKLSDIGREFIRSIRGIALAPFYALAYFFAALYSNLNPMGGRKLASAIERDWDEGVTLAEGYWSVQGQKTHWHFEGGGGPKGLGRNGFYLAGCWQPFGIAEFKDGEIINAYRLEATVDSKGEKPYHIQTRTSLETQVNNNRTNIQSLIAERTAILEELNRRGKPLQL